jgi:predicted Na+-dependent transporter
MLSPVVTPFVASLFASGIGHSEAVRVSIAIAGVVPIIGALLWIGVSPNRVVRQLDS